MLSPAERLIIGAILDPMDNSPKWFIWLQATKVNGRLTYRWTPWQFMSPFDALSKSANYDGSDLPGTDHTAYVYANGRTDRAFT